MRKILLFLLLIGAVAGVKAQKKEVIDLILITPTGITFENGDKFKIIENNKSSKQNIDQIVKELKISHPSKNLKIDKEEDAIIINDLIPGYTKTDKSAGSAYLLDLSYKIVVEMKDNKFKINVPTILIAANQKYESDAVIFNKGVQFTVQMGIKGKRDVWNSKEKTMFIYDEKDKLVEKSTKEKLERDLSAIINIIAKQDSSSEW